MINHNFSKGYSNHIYAYQRLKASNLLISDNQLEVLCKVFTLKDMYTMKRFKLNLTYKPKMYYYD